MLIGHSNQKPDLKHVRRIKETLREALALKPDSMITVTQLACLEDGCAPLETVIGLLNPDSPQLQHKLHKATNEVTAEDLVIVCNAWGYVAPKIIMNESIKEN